MSKIKKPVIYDTEAWYIEDADGNVVCDIDAEGLLSDEFHFIGNEIATAINEHADLKARLADANRGAQVNALVSESLAKKLKLAVEALIHYRFKCERGYCGHDHRNEAEKCHVDRCECVSFDNRARTALKQIGEQR